MRPGQYAVGDPVGNGPGLTGPGTSEHHDRPLETLGYGALLVVESLEYLTGFHAPMLARMADVTYQPSTGRARRLSGRAATPR